MNRKLRVDFFIAGFPKCGTTSLAQYLSEHPKICFSEPKEPQFFNTDFPGHKGIDTWEKYTKTFSPTECSRIFGEGTVIYIYSDTALQAIAKHNPDAKFIFILRNPIEIVQSLHSHLLRNMDEDVASLTEAWALQTERKAGRRLPPSSRCLPTLLHYQYTASQGARIKNFLNYFSKDQCLFLHFNELKRSPEVVYQKAIMHLDLENDQREDFPAYNTNQSLTEGWSGQLGKATLSLIKNKYLVAAKNKVLPIDLGIKKIHDRLFLKSGSRKAINPDLLDTLTEAFSEDNTLVKHITGIDPTAS